MAYKQDNNPFISSPLNMEVCAPGDGLFGNKKKCTVSNLNKQRRKQEKKKKKAAKKRIKKGG